MRTEVEQHVDKQMVRYIVQRNIFCPITGNVLDVRTCKWFVDSDGDPAYVVDPLVYDRVKDQPDTIAALEARGYYLNGDGRGN